MTTYTKFKEYFNYKGIAFRRAGKHNDHNLD